MQTIINKAAAAELKKPTKVQAEGHIKALVESLDLTEEQQWNFAKLYKYFLPTPPAKPKTAFDWVLKAVAKKDHRHFLKFAHVENGVLCGTDGHRLHLVTPVGLEDGFYDAAGNRAELDARFPSWERVIPKTDVEPLRLGDIETELHQVVKTLCVTFNGHTIDKRYWDEAVIGMTPDAQVYCHEVGGSILIDDGDRKAVIMPVRV